MEIAVSDVSFAVGARPILDRVSIDVPTGSMVAVIGPNGAGKSTLLRVVSGILRPTEGRVTLDGHSVRALPRPDVARRLAYLPQQTWTDFGITVEDAVAMGRHAHLSRWRGPGLADLEVVRSAMDRLGVADLAPRTLPTLSGGERQRVFLARALAQESPILVLDEPTTALDVGHQLDLMELLRALHAEGRTVVCAVHDLPLVHQFFPRTVVMDRGRVVADGPTVEVLPSAEARRAFGVRIEVAPDGGGLRFRRG